MANPLTTMDAKEDSDGIVVHRALPSWSRLLLFAVLLPAVVAIFDQLLLKLAPHVWLRVGLYPWLVASTAALSWCSGRYLYPAWLRWFVFVWCLALLDFLTIAACMDGKVDDHIGYVLVSAQISLVVLWAILSPVPWQLRVPVIFVIAPVVMTFASSVADRWTARNWSVPMILAMVVIAVVCGGLRAFGFILERATTESTKSLERYRGHQFGMKHMLIWAAALGPLLLVLRGLDFLVLTNLGAPGTFPVALLALCVATVNLIAIWAMLGHGPWVLRLLVLILVPVAIAVGMNQYTNYATDVYNRSRFPLLGTEIFFDVGEAWITWLCLDAALLAALLLFLRASGYRLMRKSQHAPGVA